MNKLRSALYVCLGLAPLVAHAGGGALDGRTYSAEVGEKGKPAEKGKPNDDLVFTSGQFRSTGCDPYGFTPAAYTTQAAGDGVKFEADTTSAKEGKIHWTGRVRGDRCCLGPRPLAAPGQRALRDRMAVLIDHLRLPDAGGDVDL